MMQAEPDDIFAEIQAFVEAQLERRAVSPEEIARLEQLVLTNDAAAEIYVKYILDSVNIFWTSQVAEAAVSGPDSEAGMSAERQTASDRLELGLDSDEVAERSEYDALRDSTAMILPAIREESEDEIMDSAGDAAPAASEPTRRPRILRLILRRSGLAAAVMLAIGVTAVLLHRRAPVATLTQAVGATWGDGSSRAIPSPLRPGDQFSLTSGYCSLHFADGTEVTVQGPARFTAQSRNKILLGEGKLAAVMPEGSRGFVVQIPSGMITDLGTEFGVSVGPSGDDARVDVFKGKVDVATGSGDLRAEAQLTAGESARVAGGAVKVDPSGAQPQAFVRNLEESDSTLDVADLVSGGDGTTHRTGVGIEPATGQTGIIGGVALHSGDNQYHRISSIPILDGCFIPGSDPIQVDSAGHVVRFNAKQPATYDRIYTGGVIPARNKEGHIHSELGGIDYSAPNHRWLFLHANAGLTIDLNAVRRLHPALRLSGLHAVAGNSDDEPTPAHVSPHMLILMDGVVRYDRAFTSHADIDQIDIAITDADKFLTIVALSEQLFVMSQDMMCGDPVFKMNAIK
jgi:ferric-dicitrate binding protein FerR (iron transport regulator)